MILYYNTRETARKASKMFGAKWIDVAKEVEKQKGQSGVKIGPNGERWAIDLSRRITT